MGAIPLKKIKLGFGILYNPQKEFRELKNQSLESVIGFYMQMLLLVAVAAAVASFLLALFRAVYYDMTLNIDIQYVRMMNYSLGRATSLAFLYIFAGTFLIFILSIILKQFYRKMKYTEMLKIMFYSLTPFLLFGWVPYAAFSLAVWSLFLLVTGIRNYDWDKSDRNSIKQRD